MKKILFVGITALAMASCTHDDYAPVSKQEQYQAVFEKEFGAVNPNVNWGFTPQQVFTFDKDGKLIGTRAANPNSNQWADYLTVPTKLTDAQKEVVRKWFQNTKNPQGQKVNWSDFFVQQVYKGGTNPGSNSPEIYTINKPAGGTEQIKGSEKMNWLACGSKKDHVYNFNGADGDIMYMYDSSTDCFGFHESYGDKYYDDSYVLISGDQIDPSVAGMYFVGFDYKTEKYDNGNIEVRPDEYYSDWIVRIAPALSAPGKAKRVMVEDLFDSDLKYAKTSDWDFNDAVFDVRFENVNNQNYAVITLHAAGGTKYLTIGGQGDKGVEVHKALGVETGTMVNTVKDQGVTRPVAIFRIPVAANVNNANDIPVYVGSQILEAKHGKVTQKLCAPTSTRWMQERKEFRLTYDKFKGYVNNGTPEDWYDEKKYVKENNDFRY